MTNKIGSEVVVIIPTYRNGDLLAESVLAIKEYFSEIIIVYDGTDDLLIPLDTSGINITKLVHSSNQGQGAALQTGFEYALRKRYNYCVTFDGDTQHSALDAYNMTKYAVSTDAAIVSGTRFAFGGQCIGITVGRRHILRLANIFEHLVVGQKLTDSHNGLRVLNKTVVAMLMPLKCKGRAHATELIINAVKLNISIEEYPVTIMYHEKASGVLTDALDVLRELYTKRIIRLDKLFKRAIRLAMHKFYSRTQDTK